jgi:hypothetical protein
MKNYFALLCFILCGTNTVQAAVLSFDDICGEANSCGDGGKLLSESSTKYGGFIWDDTFAVFSNTVYAKYGNTYGAPSGKNAVGNAYGAVKSVSFNGGSTFNFMGADFAGWTYNNVAYNFTSTSITVKGFNGDSLMGEIIFDLSIGSYDTHTANLNGITRLEFSSSGEGKWWLMDNFNYSLNTPVSAVPLPASIWLLGSAFAGLVFTNRKRSTSQSA